MGIALEHDAYVLADTNRNVYTATTKRTCLSAVPEILKIVLVEILQIGSDILHLVVAVCHIDTSTEECCNVEYA